MCLLLFNFQLEFAPELPFQFLSLFSNSKSLLSTSVCQSNYFLTSFLRIQLISTNTNLRFEILGQDHATLTLVLNFIRFLRDLESEILKCLIMLDEFSGMNSC
ncbi:hypothetical protein K7X08_005968 [Anisodus acutangulus]|uniref:Uncharacterized protein n=1 Tax=Anisodus acutangulus TaxID=402998 RepID=A0A9Q1LRZ7_9SOLA|nr:hypothetical protein K7X08_005968 [Anisodus acutangulus]